MHNKHKKNVFKVFLLHFKVSAAAAYKNSVLGNEVWSSSSTHQYLSVAVHHCIMLCTKFQLPTSKSLGEIGDLVLPNNLRFYLNS